MPTRERRTLELLVPAEMCSRTKTDGTACRKRGVRGTSPALCRSHGGALPHQRERAARRIEEAQIKLASTLPKAIATLDRCLDDYPTDAALAKSAAETLLRYGMGERVMVGMRAEVEVSARVTGDRTLFRERMTALRRRMEEESGTIDAVADDDELAVSGIVPPMLALPVSGPVSDRISGMTRGEHPENTDEHGGFEPWPAD